MPWTGCWDTRCCAVEWFGYFVERSDDSAVFRSDRANRVGAESANSNGGEEQRHNRADVQDRGRSDGIEWVVSSAADGDLRQSDAARSDRSGDEIAVQRGAEHGRGHRRIPREG